MMPGNNPENFIHNNNHSKSLQTHKCGIAIEAADDNIAAYCMMG
jgi:hypothetical protein